MSGDFFDSSVIVYLFDETDDAKRELTNGLVQSALQNRDGWISFQVVQEVLNVMMRGFRTPAAPADALRMLDEVLVPLWRVMPSRALYERALDVQERYRYSFYDSLIIAAALQSGCTRLISEDLQDGQRIERLTISNPFAASV